MIQVKVVMEMSCTLHTPCHPGTAPYTGTLHVSTVVTRYILGVV